MNAIEVQAFHVPLMKAGLVPQNCRLLNISIGIRGPLTVTYEVMLDAAQLVELGAIFTQVGTRALPPSPGDVERALAADDEPKRGA